MIYAFGLIFSFAPRFPRRSVLFKASISDMPGVVTLLQKPLKAFEALEADCHFGYWAQILGQYSGFVEVGELRNEYGVY